MFRTNVAWLEGGYDENVDLILSDLVKIRSRSLLFF